MKNFLTRASRWALMLLGAILALYTCISIGESIVGVDVLSQFVPTWLTGAGALVSVAAVPGMNISEEEMQQKIKALESMTNRFDGKSDPSLLSAVTDMFDENYKYTGLRNKRTFQFSITNPLSSDLRIAFMPAGHDILRVVQADGGGLVTMPGGGTVSGTANKIYHFYDNAEQLNVDSGLSPAAVVLNDGFSALPTDSDGVIYKVGTDEVKVTRLGKKIHKWMNDFKINPNKISQLRVDGNQASVLNGVTFNYLRTNAFGETEDKYDLQARNFVDPTQYNTSVAEINLEKDGKVMQFDNYSLLVVNIPKRIAVGTPSEVTFTFETSGVVSLGNASYKRK